jgi:salicylate hydroxylase
MVSTLGGGVKHRKVLLTMRIVLAGAGIGGLTAAAALADRAEVVVLEQAATLTEVGAGLQLGPNATRVLQRLGLGDGLDAIGFEPHAIEIRDAASGALELRQPLGEVARARWGSPYLHVHRSDLQALLRERAARTADIRLGARVEGVEHDGGKAVIRLAGGGTVEADAVIGCDGLRSAVRAALFGEGRPRFTGMSAWRGTVAAGALPAGLIPPVAGIWTGAGRHFVHYYVRGGALVNFVGVVERADWTDESWTERGDKAELARDFAGWPEPVAALIEAVPEAWRWALFDRPPLAQWSKGRVSLLGDAAHPMLPSFAQGASQAIEDGEAVARHLLSVTEVETALAAYQAERLERTTRIQALSRRNAKLFHMGQATRLLFAGAAAMGKLTGSGGPAQFDWLYGHRQHLPAAPGQG